MSTPLQNKVHLCMTLSLHTQPKMIIKQALDPSQINSTFFKDSISPNRLNDVYMPFLKAERTA